MRTYLTLALLAVAALSGCGSGPTKYTCEDIERSSEKTEEMAREITLYAAENDHLDIDERDMVDPESRLAISAAEDRIDTTCSEGKVEDEPFEEARDGFIREEAPALVEAVGSVDSN